MAVIDDLYDEYSKERFLELNREQFVYLVNLFPALLVVFSDGIVDHEEWITVKRLAKILGDQFASEDLGQEKEENLMLIYKGEFRYLLRHLDQWKDKFLDALREYFKINDSSKEFVMETMYLFANASEGISEEEDDTIIELTEKLGLENTRL